MLKFLKNKFKKAKAQNHLGGRFNPYGVSAPWPISLIKGANIIHSVLVVIPKPVSGEIAEQNNWRNAIARFGELAKSDKAIEMISESLLEVRLENGMNSLALVLKTCIQWSLSYKALFFEKAPLWVTSGDNSALKDYPDEL